MWLAYVDESGNTGARLDDPDQPIHWMVAVVVPEEHVRGLAIALDGVVATIGAREGSAELHGSQLFGGDGEWKGVKPQVRINVYREALALLATHDCFVAHSTIDKRRLAGAHHGATSPHVMAFQFLAEKLDAYVNRQTDPLRQRLMLIADETHEHSAFQIDLVSQMQRGRAGIGSGRTLLNIVDTVHFVDSRTNRGVQLADLVAYAFNRSRRVRAKEKPSAGDTAIQAMLSEHVQPRVRTYRATWPAPH